MAQKLKQARDISQQAELQFQGQQYEQSLVNYKKIVCILKETLISSDIAQQHEQEIQQKIDKYAQKVFEIQAIIKAKRPEKQRISKKEQAHQKIKVGNLQNKLGLIENEQMKDAANQSSHKPTIRPNIHNKSLEVIKKQHIPANKIGLRPAKIQTMKQEHKPIIPKGTNPVKQAKTVKKQIQIQPQIKELILHNIDVSFKDIVGLDQVKSILEEAVIRPRKRPDLYQGIRAPPRGLLLYGPPGNGKTFICKALAKQCGCIFFALSASSILNKYVGQSQKMIKKIFSAAEKLSPSIIFIDQVDSMLTARSENENEASRRLKTEFLVLMDGINSPKSGQILVIGATNLPNELDSAAKRRFTKFIYIGHPDAEARREMVLRNLKQIQFNLKQKQIASLVDKLQFYSASEIKNIISEACMIPLREVKTQQLSAITASKLREVGITDFLRVISERKPIVGKEDLLKYKEKI